MRSSEERTDGILERISNSCALVLALTALAACGDDDDGSGQRGDAGADAGTWGAAVACEEQPPASGPESGYLHGRVLRSEDDQPLADAVIRLEDVQGCVSTSSDGTFTIAATGDEPFHLVARATDRTHARRRGTVKKGHDQAVDDIYLTELDPAVTRIGPEGGEHRSAEGGLVVTFPAGALTEAVDVRATRFSAGRELPAPLPSTSHFTMALDISAEGAELAATATFKVPNDLGLPSGTPVPVGSFDEQSATWVPDGMGTVSDDGEWVLYDTEHLSSFDCNFPTTNSDRPGTNSKDRRRERDRCGRNRTQGSSEVDIRTGHLLLEVDIPLGQALSRPAALQLVYQSSAARPSVWMGARNNIQSFEELSAEPTYIGIEAQVEGRLEQAFLQADPEGGFVSWLWDGRNARGDQLPTGIYHGWLRVFYGLPAEYATAEVFGGPPVLSLGITADELVDVGAMEQGRVPLVDGRDAPVAAGWSVKGVPRLYKAADGAVMIVENGEHRGVLVPAGRLEQMPELDSFSRPTAVDWGPDGVLYVGDEGNNRIIAIDADGNITTVVDGSAQSLEPQSLAVMDDGTIYVGDGPSGIVYRVQAGALVEVVGGDLPDLFGIGLGGPPTVTNPTGLEAAPDGSLYIADFPLGVRRLRADGTLESLSNTLDPDYAAPQGLALSPDGSLILAEPNRQRIRRLWPDGRLETLAGADGLDGFAGDEGWAADALLNNPVDVAVASDGTIYIADQWNARVRTIGTDGRINTVAGIGYAADQSAATPGPATDTMVHNPVAVAWNEASQQLAVSLPQKDMVVTVDFAAEEWERPNGGLDRLERTEEGYRLLRGGPDGPWAVESFDSDGLLVERTDDLGRVTSYQYDENGRLLTIEDPLGEVVTLAYDTAGLSTITDAHGRETTFELNGDRDLVAVTFADGRTTEFSYNDEHLMTGWTDGAGRTATYGWGPHGRIQQIEDGAGEVRQYQPLEAQGLMNDLLAGGSGTSPDDLAPAITEPWARYTDAAGRAWAFRYDRLGEARSIRLPDGNELTVENHGISGMPSRITWPGGVVQQLFYDDWGRLLVDETPFGDRTFSYNEPEHPDWLTDIITPGLGRVSYAYDEKGRVVDIGIGYQGLASGDGYYRLGYTDQGMIAWIEDRLGFRRSYTYDARGNLAEVTTPLGVEAAYGYDARGRPTRISDALGRETELSWDDGDRLLSMTDATSAVHAFSYDGQGLLMGSETDGVQTSFTRDGAGRLLSVSLAGAPAWELETNGEGEVEAIVSPAGRVELETDAYGNPAGHTVSWGGQSETAFFEYDPATQNLIRATDDDSEVVWTYDTDGTLTSVTQNHQGMDSPLTINYETNALGRPSAVEYPALSGFAGGRYELSYSDGLEPRLEYIYDPDGNSYDWTREDNGRLEAVSLNWGDDLDIELTLDANGRWTGVRAWLDDWRADLVTEIGWSLRADGSPSDETTPLGTATWTYDGRGRLLSATYTDGRADETFVWDARGDLTGAGVTYDEYRRLTQAAGHTYTWDEAGRVIRRVRDADGARLDLFWDGDDKLIGADVYDPGAGSPTHQIAYRYDAHGQRIARTVDGATTFFLYDRGQVAFEMDENGQVEAFYLHSDTIDRPIAMLRGGEQYVFLYDLAGNVRALLRPGDLSPVRTWAYSAFGQVVAETGTVQCRFGFQGREPDPLTGLVHFRTREYDPLIGRFLSTDPLRFTSLSNPYAFPGAPTWQRDPWGMGPPKAVEYGYKAYKAYNDVKSAHPKAMLGAAATKAAHKVGGKEAGTAVGFVVEQASSPGVGPSADKIAEYVYNGWKAKDDCARAKVGGQVFKDILRGNKTFSKAVDDFVGMDKYLP